MACAAVTAVVSRSAVALSVGASGWSVVMWSGWVSVATGCGGSASPAVRASSLAAGDVTVTMLLGVGRLCSSVADARATVVSRSAVDSRSCS